MRLPEVRIGKKVATIPIIQGGMAIRITTARLAAAAANEGGIGLIAASGMKPKELRYEIRLARSLSPHGIIGINEMVAANDFADAVKIAIDEGIDLVVAGAGFSRDMFQYGKESGTPIVPIVSSAKLAKISEKLGASAVVVEGKEAGGHLGTDQSKQEDVVIIHSPVGLPGRAVRTPFSARIMEGPVPPKVCDHCLKQCDHHFCIIRALSRAQQGDVETGLVFTGEFMPRIDRIMSVHEIFEELKQQLEAAN